MVTSSSEDAPSLDIKRFFSTFIAAKGTVPALILSTILSFGIGSTVGVVPEILSDRYSRLYYDYDGPPCKDYDHDTMPEACHQGADDAQAASAWGTLLLNMFTLFCNPVVGSLSDVHGRRNILVVSMFLCMLAPAVLVLMQVIPTIRPMWYYLANSTVGVISSMSITFAALSDTMPEEFRAPSFALILAGFYSGFASPFLPLVMSHLQVSMLSFLLTLGGFLFALAFFPETLPESVAVSNRLAQAELESAEGEYRTSSELVIDALTRPLREVTILNRSLVIRLVAVGSFFSAMVHSTDAHLLIFYIEEHLNVRETDIAHMFLAMGIIGVVFQAFLLQPLVKCLGEKGLLVTSFLSGTFHNFLYGVSKNKKGIYVALCFSQLTKTNYPVLSSLASQGASANEQGQVQGALFALNALGAAIGPLLMQFIYNRTKDNLGPGTMFLCASFLYFLGTVAVSFIPVKKEVAGSSEVDSACPSENELEEPLLPDPASSLN
jgi:DHA1 family tetracycline resistance protein-like MFS transporter